MGAEASTPCGGHVQRAVSPSPFGISAGIDRRFTDKLVVGVGLGFGHDKASIGTDGSQSTATGTSGAIYASYQLNEKTYIDGLIGRPGVYNLPTSGKLTLSRLVAAAGGLGELAIPQRVDLVRRLGEDKEACIRVNLAAIRNRAEPDIVMRADDHVIIGTNFFATPLAVIRNGFRMTYGFGFLIDRNFGNDVFGPPPYTPNGQ